MSISLRDAGRDKPRLALVTTVRNNELLLAPFLHYHHALGVTKAYVYVDSSTDGTLEIARSFDWVEAIIIDPEIRKRCRFLVNLQTAMMDDALKLARRDDFDWLLGLDVDEYAFGGSLEGANSLEKDALVEEASLLPMLDSIPPDIAFVRLPTREVVPVNLDADSEFFRQTHFHRDAPYKRRLFDARNGQYIDWHGYMAHQNGKSIVRVDADVQAFDPHCWVKNQNAGLLLSPLPLPVPAIERGFHLHYWTFSMAAFREKFRKLGRELDVWPCGTPVETPKQLFKELSLILDDAQVDEYIRKHVFLSVEEANHAVERGELETIDIVENILRQTGYFNDYPTSYEGTGNSSAPQTVPRRAPLYLHLSDLTTSADLSPPMLDINCRYEALNFNMSFAKGVHRPELSANGVFRWMGPDVEFQFSHPKEDFLLALETGPLLSLIDIERVRFQVNGREISKNDIIVGEHVVYVLVSGEMLTGNEPFMWRIVSPLIDTSNWDFQDPRILGFAIYSFSAEEIISVGDQPRETVSINSLKRAFLTGFYQEEKHGDRSFCWTKEEATIRLPFKRGNYLLSIDMGSLANLVEQNDVSLEMNGSPLQASRELAGDKRSTFLVMDEHFEDGTFQQLVLRANKIDDSAKAAPDDRELSIPFFGINLTRIPNDSQTG